MLLKEILARLSGKGVISKTKLALELGVNVSELDEALDLLLHLGKIEIVSCEGEVSLCEKCPNKGGCISNSEAQATRATAYKIKQKLK